MGTLTAGTRAAADIADQPDIFGEVVGANRRALMRARDALANARVVRFAGIGSSRHATGYGATALEMLASTPTSVLPAPGASVDVPLPQVDEPLIIASQSGRTPSLLELAERARRGGTAVIAVTNEPGSPLEEISTVTLACGAAPERIVAATKSVTAQCLLLRAIARAPSEAQLEALELAARRTLSLDVARIVGGDPPGCVVAAGFAAGWIADEIALKVIEMSGTPAMSSSVVEHFHGPRASRARVLAFLDPNDPNSGELARDRSVVTVGPHPAFALETSAVGDPSLDALIALIAGQLIARSWALHVGEDPDADRGLSKVTSTR